MNVDVLKTDGWILIQSSDDFRGCNPTCHYFLSASAKFVVDVEWNHKGTENAKENEEVICS